MPLKVEDSWRIVDGENDSFDTSILPSADSDDILLPLSSENPSSGFPSQLSSQSQGASQDSIRDFVKHQEDDKVILREPFRPSVPNVASLSPRHNTYRTPDPEFRMPIVDADDHHSSGRSSVTVRPNSTRRRRSTIPVSSTTTTGRPVKRSGMRRRNAKETRGEMDHGPLTMRHVANWPLSVVNLALRHVKRPLALLLAIYVLCGALVMTQNMRQHSILVSLSPICRIPGASYLNLSFCPDWMPGTGSTTAAPIEFEELVKAQSNFEHVLEKSADGVSLPLEMKLSESSVRDLRNLVQRSNLKSRDALIPEFDGYIKATGDTVESLSIFNSRVGFAVDGIIQMNRWTSRTIASFQETSSRSLVSSISSWLFHPFLPTQNTLRELMLRDKYIELSGFVSKRIDPLIDQAQDVLEPLSRVEGHLSAIHNISFESSASSTKHRGQVFYSLWNLVRPQTGQLQDPSLQLALIQRVDYQRLSAVTCVTAVVVELKAIKATLGELRDRATEPNLARGAAELAAQHPLSVHVETLNSGVQQLEAAKNRIRAAEDDRRRDVHASNGLTRNAGLLEPRKSSSSFCYAKPWLSSFTTICFSVMFLLR